MVGALKCLDQTFVAALVALRQAANILETFSKQKTLDLRIEVDMERRIGVWSEVGFALGDRKEVGKVH